MSSGDPSGAEKAEAEEEASETDAAQYMIDEDHRDAEDWEKHFRGGARDDEDQIAALERDKREDEESEEHEKRYLRREVQQALAEILAAE